MFNHRVTIATLKQASYQATKANTKQRIYTTGSIKALCKMDSEKSADLFESVSPSCSNLNKKSDTQTLEIDKAPPFVASDLGLRSLLVTIKWTRSSLCACDT